MKHAIIYLCAFALLTGSCRKKREAEIRNNLPGKWKKEKVAWDENNNSKADNKEMNYIPDNLAEYITFNTDGTGIIINTSPRNTATTAFTWEVTDGKHVKLTIESNRGNTEEKLKIKKLAGSDLTVETESTSTTSNLMWRFYKKQ